MPIAATPPPKPVEGIDAAWDRPTTGQMVAAGKHFIVGYVSRDKSKNITRAECVAAHAAGITVCLVWETTSNRALSGTSGGMVDGPEARRQANALGFPADRPIYVAVDFDATAAELLTAVGPYLRAFGPTALVGVYGGLRTVKYVLDHHFAAYGWQTYAWSQDAHHVVQWDPRAQARQYSNGVHIAGHDTDLDRAVATDFGQWPAPDTTGESDMQLTDKITLVKKPDVTYSSPTTDVGHILASTNYYVLQTRNLVSTLTKMVADSAATEQALVAALATLPAGVTITQQMLQAALVGALRELATPDDAPASP